MTEAPAATDDGQPSPAEIVRGLMREQPKSVLATIQHGHGGHPYGSLVLVAADHDATPLLFISTLADHTRNIVADPRVCLVYDGTAGLASPLTGTRASVQGVARPARDERLKERFVRRHPDAALYAGFGDFQLYRVQVERAHLIAGFGRIHWVDAGIVLDTTGLDALAEAERGIVDHMNEDHLDAIQAYAAMAGRSGEGWTMTGIDPEGVDLRRRGDTVRLGFDRPVGDAQAARQALIALVQRARTAGR